MNGRDDGVVERMSGVDFDDADGVRNVVGDPEFTAIRAKLNGHRFNPNRDTCADGLSLLVDDIDCPGRRVRHVYKLGCGFDGVDVWAEEGSMTGGGFVEGQSNGWR